jgi:hypothetical protein
MTRAVFRSDAEKIVVATLVDNEKTMEPSEKAAPDCSLSRAAAAPAPAVFRPTRIRVRNLPFTLDKLPKIPA